MATVSIDVSTITSCKYIPDCLIKIFSAAESWEEAIVGLNKLAGDLLRVQCKDTPHSLAAPVYGWLADILFKEDLTKTTTQKVAERIAASQQRHNDEPGGLNLLDALQRGGIVIGVMGGGDSDDDSKESPFRDPRNNRTH